MGSTIYIYVQCMGIHLESIQPAPKIAHLRNLYEASVTAALFMIITFEVITKINRQYITDEPKRSNKKS